MKITNLLVIGFSVSAVIAIPVIITKVWMLGSSSDDWKPVCVG